MFMNFIVFLNFNISCIKPNNNMATFRAIILRGKFDTKNDGKTNIKIRITHNRKTNYIPTKIFIFPHEMDRVTGQFSGPNKNSLTLSVNEWLNKCIKADMELGDRAQFLTVSQLKEFILKGNINTTALDFFVFTEELIAMTKKESTAKYYGFFAQSLKSFCGATLSFSDINLSFLRRYETYLINRGVKNGIINYMTTFRSIFNKARELKNDEDLNIIPIPQYPFKRYTMPKRVPHSKNHILTVEELRSLINYKPFNKGEELAKDMFLLMFYLIGIESIDLFHLKIQKGDRISYDRLKTGRLYSILIEPEAKAIIDKYPSKTHFINVSHKFQQSKNFLHFINNYLHGEHYHNITGITQRLGIKKQVTSKWAKHTWATIARNDCQINKDDVALCLGHEDSDNRVTDMYVKYDYRIIDESNRKVLDLIGN